MMGLGAEALSDERLSRLDKLGRNPKEFEKVKKLANDFESVFLEQMLKGMRSSVQKSGLIDGGNAEEIYTAMLDGEYAKAMAGQGGSGISEMVERQLLESMGIKSEISAKNGRSSAIKSYQELSHAPLQDSSKTVTMEARESMSQPTKQVR